MDIAANWNAADWVIVSVIGISTLVSLLRGFTREALSLAVWVFALAGARVLAPALSVLFTDVFENPAWREWAAFAALFTAELIVGMIVVHILSEAVRHSVLSFSDRVLGTGFGFARGIVIVLVAVAFGTAWLAGEGWWQQSQLIPHFALLETWTRETAYSFAGWIGG